MEANRQHLLGHFALRLLECGPQTVLDLGCGQGALLETVRTAGVAAYGIEPGAEGLDACVAKGLPVARGDACAVPAADGSVDWVCLRHVPHHLEAPRAAFAEAWRVARVGVLMAEPWYDETRPAQRLGLRADRWLKRQDRRAGRFHADILSGPELRALLPAEARRVTVETYLEEQPWSAEDLALDADRALAGVAPTLEDEREFESLLELARRGGLSANGTLILETRKESPA